MNDLLEREVIAAELVVEPVLDMAREEKIGYAGLCASCPLVSMFGGCAKEMCGGGSAEADKADEAKDTLETPNDLLAGFADEPDEFELAILELRAKSEEVVGPPIAETSEIASSKTTNIEAIEVTPQRAYLDLLLDDSVPVVMAESLRTVAVDEVKPVEIVADSGEDEVIDEEPAPDIGLVLNEEVIFEPAFAMKEVMAAASEPAEVDVLTVTEIEPETEPAPERDTMMPPVRIEAPNIELGVEHETEETADEISEVGEVVVLVDYEHAEAVDAAEEMGDEWQFDEFETTEPFESVAVEEAEGYEEVGLAEGELALEETPSTVFAFEAEAPETDETLSETKALGQSILEERLRGPISARIAFPSGRDIDRFLTWFELSRFFRITILE